MDQLIPKLNVYIIPPLLSLIMGLTLALIAIVKGKLTSENILFAFVCIFWSLVSPIFICHHLLRGNVDLIMKIERGVHFFYVYLPVVNILYYYKYEITELKSRYIIPVVFVLSFLFSLTTLTDYYIYGLWVYPWGYMAKGGIAFQLYGLYGSAIVIYFIILFIRKIRIEKNKIIRLKLIYILLSFNIIGLLTMSNMPAMNGIDFYPLGNFMFIPLAFLGYGVLSNRLMDIRSVLHVTVIWMVVSSLILIPNILLFIYLYPYLDRISGFTLFILTVIWFIVNYLYFRKVQPRIDQLFNRRKYDLARVESSFIENISSLKTLDDLIAVFTGLVRRSLSFKTADMVMCHPDAAAAYESRMPRCVVEQEIEDWFVRSNHLVDRAMVESNVRYAEVRKGLVNLFNRFDATYMVPFVQQGELMALLILPEKQNLRPLTAYEMIFINSIRAAAAIALQNSIMYGNLTLMKAHLEQMVGSRTAELKKAMDALWGEMQLAKKIQTILLPRSPSMRGCEIAVYMQPADEVGGDYYDVINTEEVDWLVIGDVSGHGVPAGLIMMMAQTALHTVLAGKSNLKPEVLLSRVNRVITQNIRKLNEDRYMTITVIACLANGKFHFSGQHQHIMIYRHASDMVELVETEGVWLGISESMKPPASGDFTMEVGDTLLLYTDGITDAWRKGTVRNQRDPQIDMFGSIRLQDSLQRRGKLSPDDIKEGILSDLHNYQFNDDITLVVLKRTA